jgi:SAM-dependent methyltransferase
LTEVFVDLGTAPPSNAFLTSADLARPEKWYPLALHTCTGCLLVQVADHVGREEIFSGDYVYFSSFSTTWLAHARSYVDTAASRLGLGPGSLVVEVASNDGYLLQYVRERGVPCLGVEPTASTARAARERGIDTIEEFFGLDLAREIAERRGRADLVIGNNVLAHVPDLHDFVAGLAALVAPAGTVTLEFPHLLELVAHAQFDTVYHEHYSYFSFHVARRVLADHALEVWDVDELPTHGGSLRLWAQHRGGGREATGRVAALAAREQAAGMLDPSYYRGFQERTDRVKNDFLAFLVDERRAGRSVVGYGAAAKGNTLFNYAGVKPDLVSLVGDKSPHKQGRWLPGSRIPVVSDERLVASRPDSIVILPWNIRDEIERQLAPARERGARFVTAIPELCIT